MRVYQILKLSKFRIILIIYVNGLSCSAYIINPIGNTALKSRQSIAAFPTIIIAKSA